MTAIFNPALSVAGLERYAGPFGRAEASHLLRRTQLGPTLREIDRAANQGFSATIGKLLAPASPPPPPLNHFFKDDPNVPIGETWINAPHLENADVGDYRYPSIRSWYFNSLIESQDNITDKMALFWLNHFGMAEVGEHRTEYDYVQLFRRYATGNFRKLIEEITVHPGMLVFLNGWYNRKDAPDENYARELIELFTVQKGRPGDTNYTEDDVRAIARVLTGWRVDGHFSREGTQVTSYFDEQRHDTEPKQLSSYFNNAVIEDGGAEEYKTLIGIIFQHPETPRAICRDLFIYFVGHKIDAATERDVIGPLAELLVESDFELKPVIENLLGSAVFFSDANRATMVKNPYEFLVSIARPLGGYGHLSLDLFTRYQLGGAYHWWARTMDMDFLTLPSVSGWKAYYQAPAYYRSWISSTTLQRRRKVVEDITWNGVWAEGEGRPFDWFAFIASLTNPDDVNVLLADVTALFLAQAPHPSQLLGLKEILLPGLPDMEWTIQYREYLTSPDNPEYVTPILNKIRDLFRALFSMAEFHLQ